MDVTDKVGLGVLSSDGGWGNQAGLACLVRPVGGAEGGEGPPMGTA